MENKMQDSQKTKDELWNRLWKEFGQLVYMEGMNDHVKEGANGDLVDFIASEISKAREELFTKEELEVIKGWCNDSLNLTENYPNIVCEEAKTIKEKLDKLLNK